MKSLKIEKNKILIVEGDDEKNLFDSYFKEKKIDDIQIMPIGGKTKFKESLDLVRKDDNFKIVDIIGIIRDADENPEAAFNSVQNSIRSCGFTPPTRQLVKTQSRPMWMILIVPSINTIGAIEDVCLKSVTDDCAMPIIDQFFINLKDKGCELPDHLNKSKTLCYLSSKKIYTNCVGIAAQKSIWHFDSPAFDNINELIRLF